jgi:hypothetical protein
MKDFLTQDPITPKDEDVEDIIRRKHVDEKRMAEQKQFYEIARKRAAELDAYMEQCVWSSPGEAGIPVIPFLLTVIVGSDKTSWSVTA